MHHPSRPLSWLLFSIPTLFYSLASVLRNALGSFRGDIMAHYQIDHLRFALLPALYYLGYGLLQMPVSIAMDRIAMRILMPALMLLSGLGIWMLYHFSSFYVACIGSFLVGVGTIISILGASNIIYANFAKRSYGLVFGLTLTVGLVSAASAGQGLAYFLKRASWKDFYCIAVVLCVVYALLAVIFIKPGSTMKLQSADNSSKPAGETAWNIVGGLSKIFKNPFLVILSLSCAFMVGPIQGFADVWGKPFLQKEFGLSVLEAVDVNAMCFWGYAVGAPLIGGVAQKYGKMWLGLIVCGLLIVVPFAIILGLPGKLPRNFLEVLLFVAGVGSAFPTLTFAVILQTVDEKLSNTAIGFANMLMMLFGFVYHFFIGVFYDVSQLLALSTVPVGAMIGLAGLVCLFRKNRAI